MRVPRELLNTHGGETAVASEVEIFAAALKAHAHTEYVPAPAAAELIEIIWRAGGMSAIEIVEPVPAPVIEPPPPPPMPPPVIPEVPPQPSIRPSISALDFRRRFTTAERANITLAASKDLEANNATLQVWLDDLNSAATLYFDSPELRAGLAYLVEKNLLTTERVNELLA